jgi:hypothetical protein
MTAEQVQAPFLTSQEIHANKKIHSQVKQMIHLYIKVHRPYVDLVQLPG